MIVLVSVAKAEPALAQLNMMACPNCGIISLEGKEDQLTQPVDMDGLDNEVIIRLNLLSSEKKAYMLNNRRNARVWQKWLDQNGFDYAICMACGHFLRQAK